MKKFITLFLAVLLAFSFAACTDQAGTSETAVSGTIKYNGVGLAGVSIMVDGQSAAVTDANGGYSLGEYTDEVTITPALDGYTFMPASLTVTFARSDADFTASATATSGPSTPDAPVENADATRIPAPTDGSLYDDFENGITPDGKWDIVNKNWGAEEFNGTTAGNVNYTADGIVVLSSKGMYYPNVSERNTGAAIVTKEALGPGRFEVAAKISPRIGMCSAFWTFYYESENLNHEIDIEFPGTLNGRIGYDSVLNTNWQGTGAGQYTTTTSDLSTLGLAAQNDGKWHKYAFEWSVKDQYVKYYIDDVLTQTITTHIPNYEGQFWIGVWLPVNWAGVPEYETSDMLVDWVAYTSVNESEADGVHKAKAEYLEDRVAGENFYPTEPVVLDENAVEIVSNSTFSGIASAWKAGDNSDLRSGIVALDYTGSNQAYRLIANSEATQTVTGVYEGFRYTVSGAARLAAAGTDSSAEVAVEFLNAEGNVIADAGSVFTMSQSDSFVSFEGEVTAPAGSVSMRIVLRSKGTDTVALVDSVSMHRVIDLIGQEDA